MHLLLPPRSQMNIPEACQGADTAQIHQPGTQPAIQLQPCLTCG